MDISLRILFFALLNIAIMLLGYFFIKNQKILSSWMMLVLSILLVYFVFLHQHPIIKMLTIIATTFTSMKVIAASQSYRDRKLNLTFNQWMVFACGWAGMQAQLFEKLGNAPLPDAWPMIRFGISRLCAGVLLILIVHVLVLLPLGHSMIYISVSIILLVAFSLFLHFGLLSISAGIWRLSGVNAYFLFKTPATAISPTEFWSKRWNVAFSEMASITIFRPLKNKTGASTALLLSFMFSGLLHELALSAPVNSGYGLPLLYFVIQGCLVLTEKVFVARSIMFLKNKLIARLWTFFWVIIPAPLLFHSQFIKQIVWPLAGLKA